MWAQSTATSRCSQVWFNPVYNVASRQAWKLGKASCNKYSSQCKEWFMVNLQKLIYWTTATETFFESKGPLLDSCSFPGKLTVGFVFVPYHYEFFFCLYWVEFHYFWILEEFKTKSPSKSSKTLLMQNSYFLTSARPQTGKWNIYIVYMMTVWARLGRCNQTSST